MLPRGVSSTIGGLGLQTIKAYNPNMRPSKLKFELALLCFGCWVSRWRRVLFDLEPPMAYFPNIYQSHYLILVVMLVFKRDSLFFHYTAVSSRNEKQNCFNVKTISTLFTKTTPHIILFRGTQGLNYVQIALGIHRFVKIPLRWLTKWTFTF